MTILGGCATAVPTVNKRTLPSENSVVLGPVTVPALTKGKDARVALAETRSALKAANGRLLRSRTIYRGVRKSYGAKTP